MEKLRFEHKGFFVVIDYRGTPNISIFLNEDCSGIPDGFWFAETSDLVQEAKDEIERHLKEDF